MWDVELGVQELGLKGIRFCSFGVDYVGFCLLGSGGECFRVQGFWAFEISDLYAVVHEENMDIGCRVFLVEMARGSQFGLSMEHV